MISSAESYTYFDRNGNDVMTYMDVPITRSLSHLLQSFRSELKLTILLLKQAFLDVQFQP